METWGKSPEKGYGRWSIARSEHAPFLIRRLGEWGRRMSGLSPQSDFGSWISQGQQRVPLTLTVCEQSFNPPCMKVSVSCIW